MTGIDVFISYKSERRKAAEHLAAVLTHYGYSVWFDYQLIKGKDFGLQIDRRIREAKAVVALWCSKSIGSRWVIEEADLAHALGNLIPVKIEDCELPVGFRRPDYVNLSSWDGSPRSHQLDPLIDAMEQRVGRPPQLDLKGLRACEETWRRFGAPSLQAFALGKPLADVEGDRKMPQAGTVSGAADPPSTSVDLSPINSWHDLTILAGREWPAVRDSADLQRLERFARHFAGTFYAEEAHSLGEEIEAEARQRAAEARQAQEQQFSKEGRIPVMVGGGDGSQTRWLAKVGLVPGAGEPFCDLDGGPEMVVVPAGTFMMGSPDDEPGRSEYESHRHRVTFAGPFAVGRHAVTRGQFAAFVNATGHKTNDRWRDPGFKQDDSHPVVSTRWDDATAYAAWLATITGYPYRLLTEAEWEYAARAGTTTPFWWGSSITPAQANYDGNYVYEGTGSRGPYRRGTVPVDSFDPNPWGLYNVHGNAWEWCEDIWHDTYEGGPMDESAWISKDVQYGRVVRGGSWGSAPGFLRAASRLRFTVVIGNVGFRLARTLTL